MNNKINKVVGVGVSKTGTSTLDICLYYLGFGPHQGFDMALKQQVDSGDLSGAMSKVGKAGYLEDAPWFTLYEEIDKAHQNCKFILTLRKSTEAHAKSNWLHTLRKGQREPGEEEQSLIRTRKLYDAHNKAVRDYFADRPDDLLEVCWENGDGWSQICPFLGVEIPLVPFPHANAKPTSILSPITKRLRRKKIVVARMRLANIGRKILSSKRLGALKN